MILREMKLIANSAAMAFISFHCFRVHAQMNNRNLSGGDRILRCQQILHAFTIDKKMVCRFLITQPVGKIMLNGLKTMNVRYVNGSGKPRRKSSCGTIIVRIRMNDLDVVLFGHTPEQRDKFQQLSFWRKIKRNGFDIRLPAFFEQEVIGFARDPDVMPSLLQLVCQFTDIKFTSAINIRSIGEKNVESIRHRLKNVSNRA